MPLVYACVFAAMLLLLACAVPQQVEGLRVAHDIMAVAWDALADADWGGSEDRQFSVCLTVSGSRRCEEVPSTSTVWCWISWPYPSVAALVLLSSSSLFFLKFSLLSLLLRQPVESCDGGRLGLRCSNL